MKEYRKQYLITGLLAGIAALAIGLSAQRFEECVGENAAYNQARVALQNQVNRITAGEAAEGDYSFYEIDLKGRVLQSENSEYAAGDVVNITEAVQTDNSFWKQNRDMVKVTFPVIRQGSVTGFVIFLAERQAIGMRTFRQQTWYVLTPVLLTAILFLLIMLYRTFIYKKKTLDTVSEISSSAKEIVKGNYSVSVVKIRGSRLLKNEIDNLVYAFELMRDELQAKEKREQQLRRSQKELLSCISHDFRTPISTIKAYSEGMRDGLARDEKTKEKYVEIIISKTETLSKMMQDLLDHTNAELNELSIVKEEHYIEAYFDRIIRELELWIRQEGISFSAQNQAPDMLVSFDENRITQVIYNLVENAIKYMDKEEKKIELKVWYDKELEVIRVSVSDNGAGISSADIPFVFDRFYRAEKSRNSSIPGSGLGLSICKYIIEAHGGEIEIESRVREGSTFTFSMIS